MTRAYDLWSWFSFSEEKRFQFRNVHEDEKDTRSGSGQAARPMGPLTETLGDLGASSKGRGLLTLEPQVLPRARGFRSHRKPPGLSLILKAQPCRPDRAQPQPPKAGDGRAGVQQQSRYYPKFPRTQVFAGNRTQYLTG